jgi:hypothetical protein
MTYFILGLCLLAAAVSSWHLSAEPFFPVQEAPEEDIAALSVSAQAIIGAERAAPGDDAPSLPVSAPDAVRAEQRV